MVDGGGERRNNVLWRLEQLERDVLELERVARKIDRLEYQFSQLDATCREGLKEVKDSNSRVVWTLVGAAISVMLAAIGFGIIALQVFGG